MGFQSSQTIILQVAKLRTDIVNFQFGFVNFLDAIDNSVIGFNVDMCSKRVWKISKVN